MKKLTLILMALMFSILPAQADYLKVQSVIPGVEGPAFSFLNGKLLVSIKLLNVELAAGTAFVIPKTKDSKIEVAPNLMDGGTLITLALDPADIKGVTVAKDPNTLPDGRPIPGVPGGVLPSLRIDTDWLKSSYYFANTLFGVYVPVKFNTGGNGGSMQFKIGKKYAGTLFLVSSDTQGKNAAFLLFLQKAALVEIAKKLDESKMNPGTTVY